MAPFNDNPGLVADAPVLEASRHAAASEARPSAASSHQNELSFGCDKPVWDVNVGRMSMGYRGEDLDLRTPQSWSATPADLVGAEAAPARSRRGRANGLNAPIWVDETLLAACNHAYDVALAHRSLEVRLEHLLHALTRIDTAAEILESRGIRVAGLRRDTATVIAGELPVAAGGGAAQPRRSADFAEVLRLAAANAARRSMPAGVDDVLAVLFDNRADFPTAGLLFRHSGHGSADFALDASEPRFAAPEPPRYAEAPPPQQRERVRPRTQYRPPEPPSSPRPTPVDSLQNARLDALEQAVRALGRDLTDERAGFTEILQSLQQDFGAHRADQSRSSGGLAERLQTIEQLVADRGTAAGDYDIGDRLAAIESSLARVNDLGGALADLSGRMRSLEDTLRAVRTPDLSVLYDRIASIERSVRDSVSETQRGWLGFSDRLKEVEAAVTSRPEAVVDLTPVSNRLDIIEEALLSRDTDAERDLANRLGAVEQALAAQRAQVFETTSALGAEIKALGGAVATQAASAERFQASVGERMGTMANGLDRHRAELLNGIERQHATYANLIDQRLTQHVAKLTDAQSRYGRELGEVHDALVKLNANQHTLAGAIDQWRTEGAGDLSVISNRIASMEREAGKPMQLLSAVASNMDTVHRIAVEKNNRRRRFWYWLFGTDDWLAASWPGPAKRIDSARNAKPMVKI